MRHHLEPEPTRDEIARCAYGLWKQAGCVHGKDREHWLQAEAMLRRRCEADRYNVRLLPLAQRPDELSAVRAIRDATGLDLSSVKAAVEKAPGVLLTGVDEQRAEVVSSRLHAAGVPVEIVPTTD